MKKTKAILAVILALTMTACTDTNSAEVSDIPDITESSTVLTTTAEETTTTTTAEITTVSETETETKSEITEAEQEDDSGIFDLSNYSGNFYDWELIEDMTVYDRKDFPVSDDIMALAVETVRESEDFIKQKEALEAAENIDDEKYKKAFDENGNAIIEFNSGVYEDFDGDGKKEAFIILESYLCPPTDGEQYIYTVFANSDGDVEFIEDHSNRFYCELKCIRYNEFMHLYIHSGWFSSLEDLDVYAVENGKAVPVWNCGAAYDIEKISNSVFLYGTATRMVDGYSLFFWNDELKKYCALVGEKISDEDMPQISKIKEDTYFSNFDNEVTGGKYYNLAVGDMECQTYIKVNGEFVKSEIEVRGDNSARIIDYVAPIPVKGINIDEAESKAIKINN